jgi:hypothetical protein
MQKTNKPSGTARTIGGTITLVFIILRMAGIDVKVSESEVIAIVTQITEFAGYIVLAYGVVVNWVKRVKTVIGHK